MGIESAAKSSGTLSGAERDAKRMADWVDAKTRDLRMSLQKLELDAKAVERTIAAHAQRFSADLESKSSTVHGLRLDLRNLRARVGGKRQARPSKAPGK